MKEKRHYYDLTELKSIPIPEVLARFGIKINHSGFFAIRKEHTASSKYYPATNTYCDFGVHDGGDVLKLYAVLSGLSGYNAIEAFANEFGLLAEDNRHQKNIELTDNQYRLIGLYGDMASKNISFDFERYTISENYKLSQKLSISLNQLKKQDLKCYEDIISSRAIPHVELMKYNMLLNMEEYYVRHEILYSEVRNDADISNEFEKEFSEVRRAEKILEIACRGCVNVKYKVQNESVVELYNSVREHMKEDDIKRILEENPLILEIYYSTLAPADEDVKIKNLRVRK